MSIVAVFAPVSFMGGIAGQYFKQFDLTVAVAVLFSLLVARIITPMLAAYFMRGAGPAHEERDGPGSRAHIPSSAHRAASAGLQHGPVLLQVPRRGYLPAMSCATCRAPARCPECRGPLALPAPDQAPRCGWCGKSPRGFECPHCDGDRLRAGIIGARRTAEEIGCQLAVSFHATTNEVRDKLVPINKRWNIDELLGALRDYPRLSNSERITFEYVMLDGVNDSDDDARRLIRLALAARLAALCAMLNSIRIHL